MTAQLRILLVTLCFLLLMTTLGLATDEYAERTDQECAVCHLDPAGGGALTELGSGFALSLGAAAGESQAGEKPVAGKLFRLLVGYLHILFAFFWFGTILYVHLILKPAYASRGLPRGEVRLGLVSIVVMGITGAILFNYRVPDASLLLESRFGTLLLAKIVVYLTMVATALLAVFFVGPRMRRMRSEIAAAKTGDMTPAELEQYDGKEGRKAYFAYKGMIYDATASPLWKNGTHMGRHQAGFDLTAALGQAPHGEDRVLPLPPVGRLITETSGSKLTPPQKVFYTMAYINLGFVLLIILILACWKWW